MSSIGTLLERLYVSIGADLSELKSEMSRASTEAQTSAASIGRSFENVGAKLTGVGTKMSAAITLPLAAVGVASIKAASDAQELQSAFNATFGDMADSMNEWAESTGNALGRSTQEIQKGANAFGLYFNQAARTREEAGKLSQQFTVLAQDLASFHNTSVDEALTALRSGLSGETEPLRRYGVFLNEAAIEAKALEMGLTPLNGKLTDQQKIMARSAIIMEKTATAQGDVMRTSGSTANQIRALQGAWDELTVTLGNILLPIITPIVSGLAGIANSFTQLDPTMQKIIVVVGGVAAAIGPLLVVIGMMASGIGAILPLLGSAGIAGAFAAIGPIILPVVAAVAGLAAAWALFGDKIGPVLSELGTKVQEVLGPKLTELFETVKTVAMELWNGPFGDAIRVVIGILGEFGAAYTSVMGEALIRIISAAVDIVTGAFKLIGDAIQLVVAILTGDWAKAWEMVKSIVSTAVETVKNVINSLVPGATDAMQRLYEGVKTWIVDRLNAVWDTVKQKIDQVKGFFYGLYDAVVGHSYIPDMVDEIGSNMARLQALMVDPAKKATDSTKEAFRGLASDVAGVLDSLFPIQAEIQSILKDMETLNAARAAGQIDAGTYGQASGRLNMRLEDAQKRQREEEMVSIFGELPGPLVPTIDLTRELAEVLETLPSLIQPVNEDLKKFGEDLGNTIMGGIFQVLTGRGSFKDVLKQGLSRILEDAIGGALKSLEKSLFGEAGLGGFLGNLLGGLFGGGGSRAVGGPTLPGKAYDVGFGEKFVPGQHGRILSRSDAMRAAGGNDNRPRAIHVSVSGARGNQEIMEMVRDGVQQGIGQYDRVVGQRVDKSFRRRA